MHSVHFQHDLDTVLDAVAVGVIKVDPDWAVLYNNAAAQRMLGIILDQLHGRNLWEILDHLPADFKQRARTADQAITSCEYERDDKWIRMDVTPIDLGCRVIQISHVVSKELTRELEREVTRRREAESALEAKQQFLQAVLDNIEAGIVACDETGTLKLFNNAARAFHGLTETPIPPEDWPAHYDLYYPDGTTLMRKEDVPLYRAFAGEIVRKAEIVIAPANGQRRTLLASGRALAGRNGRNLGAVVAMHDITHRKLSGLRIRHSLRQFRMLFNDAPVAYHEIDRQGMIRRVNRAQCRLLGLAREELVGRPVWELVPEHDRERSRTIVLEKVSGLRPLERDELEYFTASGKRLVVESYENLIYDSSGEIAGIRAAMLDITDRKQREQQAQALTRETWAREQAEAASTEIRSILERIGDAYMAFDTEWRYTYVNQRAAELALKPASELLGRCVWDEFPEAVHTRFFAELQRAMREQIPVDFDNYYAPLGKWFENTVYPSPFGVGVFYRDITDRVRTQRVLEKRTAELARKNAELETFAYVASHDLQEPLRMIGGYTALLARRYSGTLGADADEFIAFITAGVDRMQRLIKNLLTLCRLTEASEAPMPDVSVGHIVDLVCDNLDLLIEDTGGVIVREELPVVRFNETQLLQVMQNLIGNALKYRSGAPPQVRVCMEREEAGCKVSVIDNGIGFEMRHATQVFRPFNRLHLGDDGGTGIGLAICKKIVENRGGRIWVESVPGIGSKFYFTIPDALPAVD